MPYRKQEFTNGGIYHIVLRAIDNNLIFKDINDYYRGIFSIYEFNNSNPVHIWLRRKQRIKEKALRDPLSQQTLQNNRELLVEILAFCLMPNHIHLLLRQIKEGGISKFMMKVGAGYGGYFNRKYERKGYFFQNRFRSVPIKNDNQLLIVFNYIHTNPISLIVPKWKEIGIENPEKAIKFLEQYKWSSYSDYISIKNFPSVTERNFMLEVLNGEQSCKNLINSWVMYKKQLSYYKDLFLETE